jgi:hypothetical protein
LMLVGNARVSVSALARSCARLLSVLTCMDEREREVAMSPYYQAIWLAWRSHAFLPSAVHRLIHQPSL